MLTPESTVTLDRILQMHYLRLERRLIGMEQMVSHWRRANYEDIASAGQALQKVVTDAKEQMVNDVCFLSNIRHHADASKMVEEAKWAESTQRIFDRILDLLRAHMKKNTDELEEVLAGTCKRH